MESITVRWYGITSMSCFLPFYTLFEKWKLYSWFNDVSADVILGLPFNIASCAFILKIICYYCNCVPGNIQICIGNAHIYNEHIKCKNITNILTWDKIPEYVTVDIIGDNTLAFDNFLETVNYKLNNYNINNKLSFPLIV